MKERLINVTDAETSQIYTPGQEPPLGLMAIRLQQLNSHMSAAMKAWAGLWP